MKNVSDFMIYVRTHWRGVVVFDYLENFSAALVMGRYPDPTPFVDVMTPVFTALKWFFVNGSFVILLAGLLLAGWRWLRRRSAGR